MNRLKAEPALLIGAVSAVISLAIGFGLPVTPIQFGLIMAAVSAVMAVFTRALVVPAALVAVKDDGGTLVAGPALLEVDDGLPVDVAPTPPV